MMLGLGKKILLGMVLLLLSLGLIVAFTTQAIVFRVLKSEFRSSGASHARKIASDSLVDILTMNRPRLKKLLQTEKGANADTAYVFIMGSLGNIAAHTFRKGVPKDLIKANPLPAGSDFNIQLIDTGSGMVYDVAVPIILGRNTVGQVRLGIKEEGIQKTIRLISLIIMAATFGMIAIGIVIAYRFSTLITRPLSRLVEGINAVRKGNFSTRIDTRHNDEIGLVADAFNEMTARLHDLIREVEALSTVKERERIALDLHDGVGQELASIIKRLELCERLFKAHPAEALDELRLLKNKTKDVLNETRRMIFDIKTQDEGHCGLAERLCRYLKDYEKINNIAVKMAVKGSLDNISAEKCSPIFYIITEALTNAAKHSMAKNVVLDITSIGNDFKAVVTDDGKGFDVRAEELAAPQRGKYGLSGMRQRTEALGGKLDIRSAAGKGSSVDLEVPLK